jgi:hypothetical protein
MKITVKTVEGLHPEPDLSHLKTDFKNYKEGIYTPTYYNLVVMEIFPTLY